jgi:hypothetical protein
MSYKNQKTVQTKSTLSSKAHINSSFLIPHLRNPNTTMSNLQVLGTVVTSGTTTAAMVQEEPNLARDAETSVDMEVDKNDEDALTTDEEERSS